MSKGMTIAGMVVAALIFIIFLLDLLTEIPFGRAGGSTFNVIFMISALGLAIISWTTFRELD